MFCDICEEFDAHDTEDCTNKCPVPIAIEPFCYVCEGNYYYVCPLQSDRHFPWMLNGQGGLISDCIMCFIVSPYI